MAKPKITPAYIAAHIRRVLIDGGSAPHAEGVQWFFKEEVKSRGWYTGELRQVAVRFRRTILRERRRASADRGGREQCEKCAAHGVILLH